MTLHSELTELKGVGDTQGHKFALLGVKTVSDLISYYPRRYEDYSEITPIKRLQPGPVSIEGVIKQATGRYVRRGMHITEAIASDAGGSVRLVWFNQPYRAAALRTRQKYFISGQYQLSRQRLSIMNPSVELASDFPVNTARIIPIYRETKGLTSRQIRAVIKQAVPLIEKLPETLPSWLVSEHKLMSYADAVMTMHFPASMAQLEAARRRLGFEEVFQLSIASLLNRQANQTETALSVPFRKNLAREFVSHLPFELTDAQRLVVWQIYLDLQQPHPMNRLVEGDVGSGKTVVAVMAALMVLEQGWQVAFMAPTELLARQHADSIHRLLQPLGKAGVVDLLVGSLKPAQKTKARQAIASGRAQFIIGTQALIQEQVDMHKLALVVVDEQHRFGVEQRKTLMSKAGHMPHVLNLSATPIPRSLALTLYGELDISILSHKPAGRQPVVTEIIPPSSRPKLYERLSTELQAGRQLFVVCPLISDSEVLEASSAEQVYERLRKHELKQCRVGLLHGKLKPAEKTAIMAQFVRRELDVLVSTTVIEVGVDIPNATMMVIENPERFGLAQIHQLRGRVGRGQHQGSCFLLMSDAQPPSRRLRALESNNDGFKLAELDLTLRGPGAIYGTLQHGQLDLKVASLGDTKLIAAARQGAQAFLERGEDLLQYKQLMMQVNRLRAVTNLN